MRNLTELEKEIMKLCRMKHEERDYNYTADTLKEYEKLVNELLTSSNENAVELSKKITNLAENLKKQKQLKQAVDKNVADLEFKKMSFDYLEKQLLTQNHGEH